MDRQKNSPPPSITDIIALANSRSRVETDEFPYLNISEKDQLIRSRSERQLDLNSAASGYGHELYCPEGIPVETALFALLGAAALSFGFLFMEITMITGGRKRKKREVNASNEDLLDEVLMNFSGIPSTFFWKGMLLTMCCMVILAWHVACILIFDDTIH